MKLDIKRNITYNNYSGQEKMLRPTIRDAATESYQERPESLEAFKPSYTSSKVKNKNDAIRNRRSDFDKRWISEPETQ